MECNSRSAMKGGGVATLGAAEREPVDAGRSTPWRRCGRGACCSVRSRRRRIDHFLAAFWLSGCATDDPDGGALGACPSVVGDTPGLQARSAEDLALLPEGSAIAGMLSDDAVMRVQAHEEP